MSVIHDAELPIMLIMLACHMRSLQFACSTVRRLTTVLASHISPFQGFA